MRSLLLGCCLLVAGAAGASAQPWPGYGPGYGPPPPHHGPSRGYAGGYGPPSGYGFYGPPRRRCWVRPGPWGPERVCRW